MVKRYLLLGLLALLLGSCLPTQPRGQGLPLVVLTFDDDHDGVYDNAFPLMEQYGYKGTAFIYSGFMGHLGAMTWENLRTLHAAGWEIGGHTVTHPDLNMLTTEQLWQQIGQNYSDICTEVAPPTSFALPMGHASDTSFNIIKHYYRNIRNSLDKQHFRPIDRLDFGYFAAQTGYDAEELKGRLEQGIRDGESVVLYGFHRISFLDHWVVTNCPPDIFAEFLKYLHKRGVKVVTLQQAAELLD